MTVIALHDVTGKMMLALTAGRGPSYTFRGQGVEPSTKCLQCASHPMLSAHEDIRPHY